MKQRNPEQSKESRRGFLRQAGQAGFLAGAAALGAAGAQRATETPAPSTSDDTKRGYHESEHIRRYYRASGVF